MWPRPAADSASSPRKPPSRRPAPPGDLLRRLHWTVLRPLARHLGGRERSLFRGPGLELAELREYQPGDDVRYIDWNVSARTEQLYVREAYAERALDAWLVIDVSASTDWGTALCLKRDRALELAAVAGQLLSRQGNKLAALPFADRPLALLPPAGGRVQLLRVLAAIRAAQSEAKRGTTDLAAALVRADSVLRRRSLVLVVSDFLVPAGWQGPLWRLAKRHETVAVRLVDPRESALPDVGIVTLEDPETGTQLMVDTSDRGLRERFREASREQTKRISAALTRCGVDQLTLGTDVELLPALADFLSARRRRAALRGGAQRPRQARPPTIEVVKSAV